MGKILTVLSTFLVFASYLPTNLSAQSDVSYEGTDAFRYRMVAIGDMDGDGAKEFAVVGQLMFRDGLQNGYSHIASLLVVYKWDGTRYRAMWTYPGPVAEPMLDALTVGDVDNNGMDDIVVESTAPSSPAGHIRAFGYNGSGGFRELGSISFGEGVNRRNLAVGDVDNDGQNELVVGGVFYFRGFKVYEYQSGIFREVYSRTTGQDCQSVHVADVNNDGENELLIGAGVWPPYQVLLYKYRGGSYNLVWSRSFTNLGGGYGPLLHAFPGDADNDGYNEIVVNYHDGLTDSLYVFDWAGGNTFRKVYQQSAEGGLPYVGDLYNSGHNVVAFVGGNGLKVYNWNGTIYDQIANEPLEEPMEIAVGDVDNDRSSEILIGGKHLWIFEGQSTNFAEWKKISVPDPKPVNRRGHMMAYHPLADRIIIFGGFGHSDPRGRWEDTWSYDPVSNRWADMNPAIHPSNTEASVLRFANSTQKLYFFGGHRTWSGVFFDETWSYDYYQNEWQLLSSSIHPPERWQHGFAYMTKHDRFLLFGGHSDAAGFYDDTWEYNPITNEWVRITPKNTPSPRMVYGGMVYVPSVDRVFLYGGNGPNGPLSDLWIYDPGLRDWELISSSCPPGQAMLTIMAYDSESDKVEFVLFKESERETWILDPQDYTFEKLAIETPILGGSAQNSAYDSRRDLLMVFGGDIGNLQFTNDLWAFKYTSLSNPRLNLEGRNVFRFRAVEASDFDGDGAKEFAVVGQLMFRDGLQNGYSHMASLLVVYKWDGTRYRAMWTYPGPVAEPMLDALTVGDVDNNGMDDIVVESTAPSSPAGHIRAFGYNGSGGFRELGSISFGEGVNRRNLAVGDVDNDGQNELVVGGVFYFRGFKVYEYQPGIFREVYSRTTGQDCQSVHVADVNNDGENELLIGAGVWSPYQVLLYKYSGGSYNLVWSRSFTNLGGGYGPLLHAFPGDADNDGYNEIVVNYHDGLTDSLYVFDWAGGNTFRKVYQESAEGGLPYVGDLYNSGHNVVAIVAGSGLKIYDWNGSTYEKIAEEALEEPIEMTVDEVDGDGKSETLVAGRYLYFYEFEGQFPPVQKPPIYAETASPQYSRREFWVDIKIGSPDVPVNNLFGISFELHWSHADKVRVVSPASNNVLPGDFLGSDVVFFQWLDSTSGKLSIAITRKSGQGGVSGSGILARVKFIAEVTSSTDVDFAIENIVANEPNGSSIELSAKLTTIEILPGIQVWSGDTNNDGIVNIVDVLPIGLYWNKTGPERTCHPQSEETNWKVHYVEPWNPTAASYADANGNGIVDQADVLPIGINWNKTHTASAELAFSGSPTVTSVPYAHSMKPLTTELTYKISGDTDPGKEFWLEIIINNASNLFGIAFDLIYSPSSLLSVGDTQPGDLLGQDVIFYPYIDHANGKVSIAITRKAGQGGVNGSGVVAKIKARVSSSASVGDSINVYFTNASAIDPEGRTLSLNVTSHPIVSNIGMFGHPVPEKYHLYQNVPNPFNLSTHVTFDIPYEGRVLLEVYDVMGRKVKTLIDKQTLPAGRHTAVWNGVNDKGETVPSGIYYCKLITKSGFSSIKMLLVK